MKIIDTCTFFNEVETLKIRLSLLYEKVDTFVICESNLTHSGIKKSYNFLDNHHEFSKWMDKIVFLKYEPETSNLDFSIPQKVYTPSSASWAIEMGQRNFIANYLLDQNHEDIAIICDVDEIWNPSLADYIKSGSIRHKAARLEMQFHYYFLNCIGVGRSNSIWVHPYLTKVAFIKENADLSKIRVEQRLPSIGNAGWHFSYLGGAQKVAEKINAFAHQEINTPEINNLKHLKNCIHLGIDHLKRDGYEWAFRPVDWYPEIMKDEMKKYPHLIRSNLI
jgi:beta-1,4-mannosyl-glycoprotein beta-1,4-N-acetylglucosaminyltransferase